MEIQDKITENMNRIDCLKAMIKMLRQEISFILEETKLLELPEDHKTIGFRFGNNKKDDFNGLF